MSDTGNQVTGAYTLAEQSSTSTHETGVQINQSLTISSTTDVNATAASSETGNEVVGDYTLHDFSLTSTHETAAENNQSLTIHTTADVAPRRRRPKRATKSRAATPDGKRLHEHARNRHRN